MGHFYSLLNPSRPCKRPSSAIANASQLAKRRKNSHRGDADTEDQHPTTSPTTQTDDREVFLSHSGHQKSFVEQLFVDLQRENISCFFDKDSESLPKAENFPTLIFKAAQKCKVGVVVLSEEFIYSKWPMKELCAFVRAQKSVNPKLKILPLFFGLTPQSLPALTGLTALRGFGWRDCRASKSFRSHRINRAPGVVRNAELRRASHSHRINRAPVFFVGRNAQLKRASHFHRIKRGSEWRMQRLKELSMIIHLL